MRPTKPLADQPGPAQPTYTPPKRHQGDARRALKAAFPYECCTVCGAGAPMPLEIAHLDHDAGNNTADNLAWFCPTHHRMYDGGLYQREAMCVQRDLWQKTQGKLDFRACHKGAQKRAWETMRGRPELAAVRSASAKRAWQTRRTTRALP